MARKKRTGPVVLLNTEAAGYRAGLYRRLSDEDRSGTEDNSIENQSKICLDYLKKCDDIMLVRTYTDNGFTGTNFDRKGFIEMMDDLQAGIINCIIVKDLSRLGREYIGSGELIERIFPSQNIRFIAVNNNYDSLNAGTDNSGIGVPITNIANDYYSKDTSRKIRAAIEAKIAGGEYMPSASSIPYGYLRGESQFLVDEEAKAVVIRIFELRSQGMAFNAIARTLNEDHLISPGKLRYLRGITKKAEYENAVWDRKAIREIVNNPVYLGHRIHGKVKREKIGTPKKRTDPSTWQYAYHVHEAIVSQELFDAVQAVNQRELERLNHYNDGGKVKQDYRSAFQGKLFCGDCKSKMSAIRRNQRPTSNLPAVINYQCGQYARYNGVSSCFNHYIPESEIIKSIENALNTRLSFVMDAEAMVREIERQRSRDKERSALETIQIKVNECEAKKRRLWEDYANQFLSKEEYLFAKRKYDDEYQTLLLKEEEERNRENNEAIVISEAVEWISHMKKYQKVKKVDQKLIETFIQKIFIYGDKRIEIVMNFREDALIELFNHMNVEEQRYAG